GEDHVVRLSAALAYYAMFSIGPLLVIAVGLAGLAFGNDTVRRQIEQQLQSMLGEGSAKTLGSRMSAQKHGTSVRNTRLELVVLVIDCVLCFGCITLRLAMSLRVRLHVRIGFRQVWIGAIGKGLRFTVGKYLLAMYLGRASTTWAFGAAGSVIVVLMWVYYAS